MSLSERLRAELAELADTVEPAVEPALTAVLGRVERPTSRRPSTSQVLAVAAVLLLVLGAVTWWVSGREDKPELVVDPNLPNGTFEAGLTSDLAGDLAGTWRIRLGAGSVSVVAPDNSGIGRRVASATYDVTGRVLSTSLLADGPCQGDGSYRWSGSEDRLRFTVVDDDCEVRVRLLTSGAWTRVQGTVLTEGTYQTPRLTPGQLRQSARAAGFTNRQVDRLLGDLAEAKWLQYTLQVAGGSWTEYESVDGDAPASGWSGHYDVLDAGTVVAGEPPCGPITYDYRYDGSQVRFVVVDDECQTDPSELEGELFAQHTIYESAPFTRDGD